MVDVRVGIVSWNTAALLDDCLAALPAALGPLDAEIVVVDNASTDESVDVVARHGGVRMIRNERNLGYGRAMNQALAGSEAPVLIALNPDTRPDAGTLADLVRRLNADPSVGLVAPRLLDADGIDQQSVYRFPSPALAGAVSFASARRKRGSFGRRWWLEGYSDHRRCVDVDWAIGAVHVIRTAALADRLPYSERWFMYVEDLELCWWLDQHGWRRRLEGEVAITHVGNAAGSQRWGEHRTARWLEATYDWYRTTHGRPAMDAWGAVNVAGLLWFTATQMAVWLRHPAEREAARTRMRWALGLVPQHVRIMLLGPSAS